MAKMSKWSHFILFKFNCSLGNCYFWRCMLEHTKRQVHKWKFLQHALSRYVYNGSLFDIFKLPQIMQSTKRSKSLNITLMNWLFNNQLNIGNLKPRSIPRMWLMGLMFQEKFNIDLFKRTRKFSIHIINSLLHFWITSSFSIQIIISLM